MSKRAARRKGGIFKRKLGKRGINPTILIVCEGENTEPSYFKQFRLSSLSIEVKGAGRNTVSLVDWAKELSKKNTYDQVWCVFDKDDYKDDRFNQAAQKAKDYGFKAALSNQAFEYWLILHLEDHQGGGMDRDDYDAKINKWLKPHKLKFDGKGSKIVTKGFFEHMETKAPNARECRRAQAVKRAWRIHTRHIKDERPAAKWESCTTVYLLVEELMKHIKHGCSCKGCEDIRSGAYKKKKKGK